MLASELINSRYPVLHMNDKVSFALQLMNDYDIVHLPVLNDDKFSGLIDKDDLLDADEKTTLLALEYSIIKNIYSSSGTFFKCFKSFQRLPFKHRACCF